MLLCGCETWLLRVGDINKLEMMDPFSLRRILRVLWQYFISNSITHCKIGRLQQSLLTRWSVVWLCSSSIIPQIHLCDDWLADAVSRTTKNIAWRLKMASKRSWVSVCSGLAVGSGIGYRLLNQLLPTTELGQLSLGMRPIYLTDTAQPIPDEWRNKYN